MPRRKNRSVRVYGIGLDLISLPRIKRFIRDHGLKRIKERIFSDSEVKLFGRKKISAVNLAKRFAAKEAYFKALNQNWMGLDGFRNIQVKLLTGNRFSIKSSLDKQSLDGVGKFFAVENLIGAHIVLWSKA